MRTEKEIRKRLQEYIDNRGTVTNSEELISAIEELEWILETKKANSDYAVLGDGWRDARKEPKGGIKC